MSVELANVADEQVRHLVCRVVAASVVGMPGNDVAVVAFGQTPNRPEVVREAGEPGGDRRRLARAFGGVHVVVVLAARGRSGVREPVDRDVGERKVVTDRWAEQLTAPRELPHWRVGEGVGERLRLS